MNIARLLLFIMLSSGIAACSSSPVQPLSTTMKDGTACPKDVPEFLAARAGMKDVLGCLGEPRVRKPFGPDGETFLYQRKVPVALGASEVKRVYLAFCFVDNGVLRAAREFEAAYVDDQVPNRTWDEVVRDTGCLANCPTSYAGIQQFRFPVAEMYRCMGAPKRKIDTVPGQTTYVYPQWDGAVIYLRYNDAGRYLDYRMTSRVDKRKE